MDFFNFGHFSFKDMFSKIASKVTKYLGNLSPKTLKIAQSGHTNDKDELALASYSKKSFMTLVPGELVSVDVKLLVRVQA